MPFLPRILITPTAFRISRPGVNVQNPPSTTPEHLAMNSDWPGVERRHAIILVRGNALVNPVTLNFTALDDPPFAVLLTRKLGTDTLVDTKTHASSYWDHNPFGIPPYFIIDTQEDTHLIDWTSRNQALLMQKPKIKRGDIAPAQLSIDDLTKYDFIVMLFKQGAS